MTALRKKLKKLDERREDLIQQVEEEKANLDFQCGCGQSHKIKDCDALQTHWYVRPSGCMDGDYWNAGELQIVCPETGNRNRILSESDLHVQKFRYQYRDKFKTVKDTYLDEPNTPWWNNYFVRDNPEYFDL